MYVEPPLSTGLRWAAYAAAFALVALIGMRVLSAPKTPYEELSDRVGTGWEGTYFDETPVSVETQNGEASESEALRHAPDRVRGGVLYGGGGASTPRGVLSIALLSFLLLGVVGWLGAVFADPHPFRRRPRQVESAHA